MDALLIIMDAARSYLFSDVEIDIEQRTAIENALHELEESDLLKEQE